SEKRGFTHFAPNWANRKFQRLSRQEVPIPWFDRSVCVGEWCSETQVQKICLKNGRFLDALLRHRGGTVSPSRKSVHKRRLISKIVRPLWDVLQHGQACPHPHPGLPAPGRAATARLCTRAPALPDALALSPPSSSVRQLL